MLHLIRSRFGYPLALEVASVFVYDEAHAATDAQPLVSLGRLAGYEPLVAAAIRLMESRLDSPLTTAAIARRLEIPVRTPELLFRQALGIGPGRYYLTPSRQASRPLLLNPRHVLPGVTFAYGFAPTPAIAGRREISVRTLELLFRHALGIGPGSYYLRLRLQAARRLLLDTRLSMQVVAVRCGFGSHSAFSRIFRQHFALSPSAYRRAHRAASG